MSLVRVQLRKPVNFADRTVGSSKENNVPWLWSISITDYYTRLSPVRQEFNSPIDRHLKDGYSKLVY